MSDSHMPTTIPSPVNRGEIDFIAVDADGREWHWDDAGMVWFADEGDEGETRHEPR